MEFDHWIRAWFDHPDDWDFISDDYPDDVELSDWMYLANDLPPSETIEHATHLFENAGEILRSYRNNQVGHGLYALIWEGSSPLYALRDPLVPESSSRRCLKAISTVYEQIFALRCTENLGHCSEALTEIDGTCYMWWDVFPAYGGCLSHEQNKAVLSVMERALALPNAICQESALHGLGHWHHYRPEPVEQIIDAFLNLGTVRRPELLTYASNARSGYVL